MSNVFFNHKKLNSTVWEIICTVEHCGHIKILRKFTSDAEFISRIRFEKKVNYKTIEELQKIYYNKFYNEFKPLINEFLNEI